jgi:RES domain
MRGEPDILRKQANNPGRYRFDAPAGEYPVTYTAATFEACVAEKFQARRAVEHRHLTQHVSLVSSRRDLHLVPFHDSVTLAQFGLDARIWTTIDYPSSQRWSLHLHAWFPTADGIYYRPRHAHEQLACCLFLDRCSSHLDVRSNGVLGADRDRLLTAAVPRGIHVEFST